MGTTQENDQHEYDNYSDFIKAWIKIPHSIPWICTAIIYKLKINKSQINSKTKISGYISLIIYTKIFAQIFRKKHRFKMIKNSS